MKTMTRLTGVASLATVLTLLPVLAATASEVPRDRQRVTLADGGLAVSSGGRAELNPAQSAELTALDEDLPSIQAATVGGVFDYTRAVALGADAQVAVEWARGVVLAGGRVSGLPDSARVGLPLQPQSRAACRGANAMWSDWLGWHARLDSCNTLRVVDALRSGAGATTVASIIITAAGGPIGAVSAIMPALLTWSAASVEACSRNGTGVEVAFAGFICWAQ